MKDIYRSIVLIAFIVVMAASLCPAQEERRPSPEEVMQALKALQGNEAPPAESTGVAADIDLAALKQEYQNAIVKIEFTGIINKEETKMNPTKSERYYSGDEPPHGSGFFISESEILTNAHVIQDARMGSIRVKSPATGNVEFKVDIVGVGGSETIDLAILELPEDEILRFKKRSGLEDIPYIEFGDSGKVKQADALAVFGYPQSSDELKIIQAEVTGRQYLKIDLGKYICGHQFIEVGPGGVVQPGNSGGPAINARGRCVGVPSRGSGWGSERGWLIPSNIASHFLERIRGNDMGKKPLELPRLGVTYTENFPGTAVWAGSPEDVVIFELGVVIRDITPGSLADKWGFKEGDILVGFANERKGLSCALDFEGYRVVTGRMSNWPEGLEEEPEQTGVIQADVPKFHISEMIMTSNEGDHVTIWYIRDGKEGIQKIEKKMTYLTPVDTPHLGTFEKPEFELWGDFVAQDFNDYNSSLFEAPPREVMKGGVLVTFVEPNSLASRRGMKPSHRSTYGFTFRMGYEPVTQWVIIDTVNGEPVKNLEELKAALRKVEERFEEKKESTDYDPARRILLKERYARIGFRTNTFEGDVLRMDPAFPIDEALKYREE